MFSFYFDVGTCLLVHKICIILVIFWSEWTEPCLKLIAKYTNRPNIHTEIMLMTTIKHLWSEVI